MKQILLILCLPLFSYAQTGPGGVGTNDGTSNLVLWLDANTITGTNGATITTWTDMSGNGHDFTVGNGAVYNTSTVNGYPAFNFNGSSHYFERAYTAAISPAEFTIFSSTNVTASGGYKAVISNRDDPPGVPTAGFILYSRPTSNQWQFWTGEASGNWQVTGAGTSTQGVWAGQVLEYKNVANGKILYIDGNTDDTDSPSMTTNMVRPFRIGAGRNESIPDYHYQGDIAEVIMFDAVINSAQKIIINNYLAAKYNYALGANDIYNEDDAANGNYDHDVAGIGRVDASNIHNDAQGTGIIRMLNPAGIGDDEFLLWGHDNGTLQATNTADIPGVVQARFDRVWRASEVNASSGAVDVGAIDVRFDLSNLNAVTASDLRLLVDTDNDGIFADETPIGGATSLGGNIYQFSGVTAIANNLRFTLGTINTSQTSLPIELVSFNVKNINDESVKIEWQTAAETNNDYFNIERSQGGINWEIVNKTNGAGNSSSLVNYVSLDNTPYKGLSYYRLKQTDFNGDFSYSPIRSVDIEQSQKHITIYPNPAINEITIAGNNRELEQINIYNILGKNVTNNTIIKSSTEQRIVIDLSNLNSGIYYVKTKNTVSKVYKK